MRLFHNLLLGSAALVVLAPEGHAHFRLIEPASWLQESQIGDPDGSQLAAKNRETRFPAIF
jgi:hypothetical protein